jgi:hypothetical protein
MSDRYYVSLTATCTHDALADVLDRMQAAQHDLATTDLALDGLSLSFTRDDGEEIPGEVVTALPVAGPVISTGPGTPPPDAVDMPIVEPEPGVIDPAEPFEPGQHEERG